jgi:hypothetical protein
MKTLTFVITWFGCAIIGLLGCLSSCRKVLASFARVNGILIVSVELRRVYRSVRSSIAHGLKLKTSLWHMSLLFPSNVALIVSILVMFLSACSSQPKHSERVNQFLAFAKENPKEADKLFEEKAMHAQRYEQLISDGHEAEQACTNFTVKAYTQGYTDGFQAGNNSYPGSQVVTPQYQTLVKARIQ